MNITKKVDTMAIKRIFRVLSGCEVLGTSTEVCLAVSSGYTSFGFSVSASVEDVFSVASDVSDISDDSMGFSSVETVDTGVGLVFFVDLV